MQSFWVGKSATGHHEDVDGGAAHRSKDRVRTHAQLAPRVARGRLDLNLSLDTRALSVSSEVSVLELGLALLVVNGQDQELRVGRR